jgi:hypothetical protein
MRLELDDDNHAVRTQHDADTGQPLVGHAVELLVRHGTCNHNGMKRQPLAVAAATRAR